MNQKALELLEYARIREQLAGLCGFSLSKELAQGLVPSSDGVLVARRLALTSEATRVLNTTPNLSTGGARDIRPALERAQRGGVLDPEELLAVQTTIAAARVVRTAILRLSGTAPALAEYAELMVDYPGVEHEIGRCIGETGDILDGASPALARTRAEIKTAHQRLLDKLHDIVFGGSYRHALQEQLVTIREGRYVVPVRSDSRSQLKGLIHDQSSSGQTVYVEPFVTVELSNRWRQLQLEEQREIERILRELSGLVGTHAVGLEATVVNLGQIDLNLAKARLAESQRGIEPDLEFGRAAVDAESRGLRLVKARHPLLKGKVVPIDLRLGDDFRVMVITGPNTGGKTVALKTAGLLTLMAQAGLHIPAEAGSRIHVFEDILADIGDEQSIEQSLSTFSSHMRNVVGVIRTADRNTLVLLDEVGAGTDPAEGSALARAVLNRLLAKGSWVIATTHYTELKAFAHDTEGMINASVEFDSETLAPTYRLQIGLPGKSNALAIAARLGLDPEVLTDAGRMVDTGQIQVENLLAGIQAERQRADELSQALDAERREAARIRRELEQRLRNIESERREVLHRARREIEQDLATVRAQLRQAAALAQRQERNRVEILSTAHALEATARQALNKPLPSASAVADLPTVEPISLPATLVAGDRVRLISLDQEAQINAIDGDTVEVLLGNFKLRVGRDEIEWVGKPDKEAERSIARGPSIWNLSQRSAPGLQLDLRGWRADQVGPELERYLNDAYMSGMRTVRIIHGKGTGVLRQVVREHLAASALIENFESADPRDGGDGATVAYLAV